MLVRQYREMRIIQESFAEFPIRKVLQCDVEALPYLVRKLRAERDKRIASYGPCPFAEQEDYGWNDGAIPSIRESGKPGSKERIERLRDWYASMASIEEEDGSDEACSSPFLPTTNVVGNTRLSDTTFAFSIERSETE